MAHDVNTRLALGALNAGIGHTHINSLLSCLDIPTLNHETFKTREREVGKAVEHVANESRVASCCEEREMAMAAGAKYDSENVPYGIEKISDFIHTKSSLNTRLYNLSQRQKFPNSSFFSQKVVSYLVKCFAYCVHQHKNQPEELAKAIQCIVPHAISDHSKCDILWCRYKQNPTEYTDHELLFGKDLHGSSLARPFFRVYSPNSCFHNSPLLRLSAKREDVVFCERKMWYFAIITKWLRA